ncbi:MAG: flagellar hook-associated protein FlgK, partial [Planctomycetota bacterium]
MSLYSSIRMTSNTMRADQIAMQVIGQNIANANTPGYIREETVLAPAPVQQLGSLLLGLGVDVKAVIQKIDTFLEERLRGSVSDRSSAEVKEETYGQLEGLVNELGDMDLSTDLNNFFSAISEILNQPESVSVRNLAVLQGKTLATNITRLSNRVSEVRNDLNDRVVDMAERINKLTETIQKLNIRIAETEGGDVSNSDAVGLRDQRLQALEELAELIDIRVEEQESGGVTVYAGGDFLVYEGTRREVEVVYGTDRGLATAEIHLKETDSPLDISAGELAGLITSRDDILGGFLDQLDNFAGALIFEFNKVFSSGQGLNGFSELTSTYLVDETDVPLDTAGLDFTPQNGSFDVILYNTRTGEAKTTTIKVDLNGINDDTTLEDLAAQLDAIDGLTASADATGRITISADSIDQQFAFANDSSGVLAALGLNTFFTGSTARDIAVNTVVQEDPSLFAASAGGIGVDTDIALELADFLD